MITCVVTILGSLFSSIIPKEDTQRIGEYTVKSICTGAIIIGIAYFIIFFGYYIYSATLANKRSKLLTVLKIALKYRQG